MFVHGWLALKDWPLDLFTIRGRNLGFKKFYTLVEKCIQSNI